MNSADFQWKLLLTNVLNKGRRIKPRGLDCLEVLSYQSIVDMRRPIISCKPRNLGYRFMAAEAHWILSGDNRVETIAPFSKHISQFSDNGITYFGAYGPKFSEQIGQVIITLATDRDSRQAVMTIWRENPPKSKDIPCTISVQWVIRDGKLHCIDNMRSSDSWLGWPYDVFNFSMASYYIALVLKEWFHILVGIGNLYMNCGSQHVYDINEYDVRKCLTDSEYNKVDLSYLLEFNGIADLYAWLEGNKYTGGLNPWDSE